MRGGLEAASGGYRWSGRAGSSDQASAIRAGAHTAAARAAEFVLSNPHGARAVQVLVDNLVGSGIKPKCRAESETVRQNIHRGFGAWTDRVDATSQGDFYALTARLVRDMVVLGEALAVWDTAPDGTPHLRQLHPDQLDRGKSGVISESRYAVQGIEFDRQTAAPVAYWIRPGAPGGLSPAGGNSAPQRAPAGDINYMFRPLVPGQVRGLSWFAPVLLAAHELDQLLDALLVRAKVSALHTGFVYDPSGQGAYSGTATGDTLDVGMEPSSLLVLSNGRRVEFPNLPDSGDAKGPPFARFASHHPRD